MQSKKELNYRRGQTWRNCGGCDHFVDSVNTMGLLGRHYPACHKIGLKPGRAYCVHENNQCDAFDNTAGLKKLKGEK